MLHQLLDADYSRNLDFNGLNVSDFQQSLFILTTVISGKPGRYIVDCGQKAAAMDSGPPIFLDKEMEYINGGDAHGIMISSLNHSIGDKLMLIPGHCDPTVNLVLYFYFGKLNF